MIIIISILAILLVAPFVLLLCRRIRRLCHRKRQRKYDDFILQNSLCLKQLKEINNRYKFDPDICLDQWNTYDNENIFNTISCKDYLIYKLQYIEEEVIAQIKKTLKNKQIYSDYLNEVKAISNYGKFQSPINNLNLEKLIIAEKRCINSSLLQQPSTHFSLKVTLYCSKINGHIYDEKTALFYDNDIFTLTKRLHNKKGSFYSDREIWDALCRVERGKVTNKMRFSIYERDGYKCRKCGVSGNYANLEIDHIIPISKGGKSTYDNLQTLCHDCNVEKGNRIERKY
ncbi:MAG: HNH endonuclease [Roseburia sp.]|nr:HNH endonuclease [Roseburia sp.]